MIFVDAPLRKRPKFYVGQIKLKLLIYLWAYERNKRQKSKEIFW